MRERLCHRCRGIIHLFDRDIWIAPNVSRKTYYHENCLRVIESDKINRRMHKMHSWNRDYSPNDEDVTELINKYYKKIR